VVPVEWDDETRTRIVTGIVSRFHEASHLLYKYASTAIMMACSRPRQIRWFDRNLNPRNAIQVANDESPVPPRLPHRSSSTAYGPVQCRGCEITLINKRTSSPASRSIVSCHNNRLFSSVAQYSELYYHFPAHNSVLAAPAPSSSAFPARSIVPASPGVPGSSIYSALIDAAVRLLAVVVDRGRYFEYCRDCLGSRWMIHRCSIGHQGRRDRKCCHDCRGMLSYGCRRKDQGGLL